MVRPAPVAAAVGAAALLTPSAAFVASPAATSSAPALRTAGAGQERREASSGPAFGATASVCGVVAAAGLAALNRRRTATNVVNKPVPVVNWQVDAKIPVPGSQKALGGMVGADVETGGEVWDPMGFSKLYDRNFDFNNVMTYPHVQWLREAEIKHGRVCMLAFVGVVTQHFVTIPGYPVEPDWIKALSACYASKVPTLGLVQISVFLMLVEGRYFPENAWIGQMDREPGDLGFDPLKLTKKPGYDLKRYQTVELKNGRLAMIAMAAFAANHVIPGSVPLLTGAYAVKPESASAGASSSFCGASRPVAQPAAEGLAKTANRYTTQVILPQLQWLKSGVKSADIQPTQLVAKNLGGVDVLIGKTEGGSVFCVGNLCPHIGTPMSEDGVATAWLRNPAAILF